MDRLENIETFVRVAETGSFAEAARQLRIAKSVVTDRIKQLEDYVGGALFHRNTRVVRLSDVGQAFLPECIALVARADGLLDHMRNARGKAAGILRIHVLTGLVLGHFAPLLRDFQKRHPEIRIELMASDTVVDPVKAGVDCALQIFPHPSGELISRPMFPIRRVFCATPAYLRDNGSPGHPGELREHALGLYGGYPTRDRWTFHHKGSSQTFDLVPRLLTNSVHLLREYALEDAGIVCLPTLVASHEIRSGALRVVLPHYLLSSFTMSAVYAVTSREAMKLKLFIDHVNSAFSSNPPWDAALIEAGLLPGTLIAEHDVVLPS